MNSNLRYHLGFQKNPPRKDVPVYYRYLQHLAEVCDGITGLLASPFDRCGTCFTEWVLIRIIGWDKPEGK